MAHFEFVRPDGRRCPAYIAEPTTVRSGKALVLIHEMWGVAKPIRDMADHCAAEGYRVVVPDLFRGKLAEDIPSGLQLMSELDFRDATEQDIRGAASWLEHSGATPAVIGLCMGGALAILAAMHVPELHAAVCFYGLPPPEAGDPANIKIPLLAHFARHDDWCTPDKVDAFESRLQAGNVDYALHRYDAQHAFMNPDGAGYSTAASRLAWGRTLEFLEQRLPEPRESSRRSGSDYERWRSSDYSK